MAFKNMLRSIGIKYILLKLASSIVFGLPLALSEVETFEKDSS
jgi:hypothetical protein